MRLLIVGCGYVGSAVAQRLRSRIPECTIYALTRSEDRVEELRGKHVSALVGDWLHAPSLEALPEVDFVLVAVPHRPDESLQEETHRTGLSNLIGALQRKPFRLVYLSTTGVYGECEDEVVDEETQVSPTRIGPRIAVKAEQWLAECAKDNAWTYVVLRLAGIYGPGRVPLAARLRSGEPLAVPQAGFLNLVHVHDIARMIQTVLCRDLKRAIYVFSDGQPVPRTEFYTHLAELCGVSEPVFGEPDPNGSRTRRATSKRVSPKRLVTETGFEFEFPNYRMGLTHALSGESQSDWDG